MAIAAVAIPKISEEPDGQDPRPASTPERARPKPARRPKEPTKGTGNLALPENPDEVTGDQPYALTRTPNFRSALRVLDERRRSEEGVFDGLRVAPGRIDTVVETADRRINLQIRPDMKIAFESESEFPNRPDYRRYGLAASAIDPRAPERILRRVDRARPGSAAHDVDYIVIRRDIIDFRVNVAAYLRTGARPRTFVSEPGEPLRGF